ncbi:MAG: glycosyltransferase family 39 protein [Saprospiraceae bacterium]|nr:glycosyltransferase family 39 protein [Lewinella sp.]
MRKPIWENALLAAMLILFSAGLIIKGYVGEEEQRSIALQVLLAGIPVGVLLMFFRSLDQRLPVLVKKGLSFFRQPWLRRSDPALLFVLCGIVLFDLLYIGVFRKLVDDENEFINAIRIFVEQGRHYFLVHYSEITWLGPQHPPLPVFLIGYIVKILGTDVYFPARITAVLLGLGIAVFTYHIARQLYDRTIARWAVILLFAIRYFNLAQVTSNNDIFVTFFFTLTVLLVLKLKATEQLPVFSRMGWAVAAGISLGLGLLSKYTMFLAYAMLLPLIFRPFAENTATDHFFSRFWSGLRSNWGVLLVLVITSLAVFYIWVGYMIRSGLITLHAGQLMYYLGADVDPYGDWKPKVIENGYFSSWRLNFLLKAIFYGIPSGIGTYILPLLGLGIWAFIRQQKERKKVNSNGFIRYWLAIVFIPMLIALPVHRYFMPAFPALAILMAAGLHHFYKQPYRILILALFLSYVTLVVYMS